MKKFFMALVVMAVMSLAQLAFAAPTTHLVQTVDVVADKNVTPLDFSFFDQTAPGRVELSNIKNLWGAGAGMIFYVNTHEGSDWLMLGFGGGMVEIRLQNKKVALFSEKVEKITAKTPLILNIYDGQLTAEIGNRKKTIDGVTAFTGKLTTQSIEATLNAYQFDTQQ